MKSFLKDSTIVHIGIYFLYHWSDIDTNYLNKGIPLICDEWSKWNPLN